MGRLYDAREIVTRLKTIVPVVVPNFAPFRNRSIASFFLGLRLAAGETT
jgi:hypothetical protein